MIKGEIIKRLLLILALALSANAWAGEILKTYYSSGELSAEAEYIQGKKEGAYKKYHKNGNAESIGQYLDDKKSGLWYFYAKDGALVQEGTYVQDKEEGLWKTYFNLEQKEKKVFELIQFENGLANGISATLYPDGKTARCKISYVTGITHGMTQSFYPTGNIKSQIPFKEGKMHGKGHTFDKEGQAVFEYTCANGQLYSRKRMEGGKAVGAGVIGRERRAPQGFPKQEEVVLFPRRISDNTKLARSFNDYNSLTCGDAGWTKDELSDDQ